MQDLNLRPLGYDLDGAPRVHPQHLRNFNQLHNIQPPLPAFVLGDERLWLAELIRDLLLGEAGVFPGGNQPVQDLLVLL